MKPDNEKLLKKAASLYVARMGEELINENAPGFDLDAKQQQRIRRRILWGKHKKAVYIAAPMAACLLIAMLFIWPLYDSAIQTPSADSQASSSSATTVTDTATASETASTETVSSASPVVSVDSVPAQAEIAFLSTRLPEGYTLTQTDYDHDKTIYYINNIRDNKIILVAEPSVDFTAAFATEGFIHTTINGTDAYVRARKEYNVLLLYSDGLQYTFTSPFDAGDLIEVASAIV